MIQTESIASSTASATAAADAADQSGTTATSAADTATSSAAKFQLPGTQLSVLPIGLGVFAGISVIALIVVGLVTYERTKYRRVSIFDSVIILYAADSNVGFQTAQARRIGGGYGVWWNGVSVSLSLRSMRTRTNAYPPQASRLNLLSLSIISLVTLSLESAVVQRRGDDDVSGCTSCSWARSNDICLLAPWTVGCIIGRCSCMPVYSTRLALPPPPLFVFVIPTIILSRLHGVPVQPLAPAPAPPFASMDTLVDLLFWLSALVIVLFAIVVRLLKCFQLEIYSRMSFARRTHKPRGETMCDFERLSILRRHSQARG